MLERTNVPPRLDGKQALPPGTPSWVTLALVERTLEVWQPYYSEQPLTVEDAVAMILAVGHLLRPA